MTLPEGYRLSHDPADQQIDVIHGYLHHCYWSPGVPRDLVQKAVSNSLCAGVFDPSGAQVGFARMVTDHVSFGYLADVFVLEAHRGKGLGHALTRDAHRLYEDCGFKRVEDPSAMMQIRRRGNYPPPPDLTDPA